ncbi:amidohydrolase family protein [Paenibacillus sp. LMG 31461]|uniref:Amidohydrolase family protein n=1 Tax=Paenibacillus plantarum TaxID=2654975 RepID=A0ABX1XB54_9BACL|nr:amidohydrolase family protein [Paenibacillus plantarum]NOU65406.1 amidohydrolase family protein [Paenibacillus plantarum]
MAIQRTIQARNVRNDEWLNITLEEDCVVSINSLGTFTPSKDTLWVSPGWIDLQVNGYRGYDINGMNTTNEDIESLTDIMFQHGVTSYYPTIITGSYERIVQALHQINLMCNRNECVNRAILGIHLEGPYISTEDGPRGAHPLQYVRDPSWEEFCRFQEVSGYRIKLLTLAPEREGAIDFIAKAVASGVVVSIGHTAATAEQIQAAVEAGATLSTHLGNGSHPILPRHPHYIWHQLAEDRLCAAFIADGHHLHPDVLKVMVRAKQDNFLLVTDCVALGGQPPGRYASLIGGEVDIHVDGRLTVAKDARILAGSGVTMPHNLENIMQYVGIPLRQAIESVTIQPLKVMKLKTERGLVETMSDLTLFRCMPDGKIVVEETIQASKSVYRRDISNGNDY